MAVTPKSLFSGTITTVPTLLYTAPADTTTVIKAMSVHNPDTATSTTTISLNPSGGGLVEIVEVALAAGDSEAVPEIVNHVLEAGGTISAVATPTATTTVLSGLEYT